MYNSKRKSFAELVKKIDPVYTVMKADLVEAR